MIEQPVGIPATRRPHRRPTASVAVHPDAVRARHAQVVALVALVLVTVSATVLVLAARGR
ncbi:hypothetical protein [Roseisolibacter sp. H3M3-2]|uniref:hypothetical protein n=1 Tax=Roseisolibacter sp. H3M3-2 TaxID=3031323 RepID=UPI0023DAAB7F|nr:hypothetical protein [Roseisolibacter sp. H3M3-2]MDF1503184.1 hypothetical protein [Roseisolibacter sp. H3M3-2]